MFAFFWLQASSSPRFAHPYAARRDKAVDLLWALGVLVDTLGEEGKSADLPQRKPGSARSPSACVLFVLGLAESSHLAKCEAKSHDAQCRRPCFIGPSFFHWAARDLARRPHGTRTRFAAIPQAMASFGAAVDDPKEASRRPATGPLQVF